MQIKIEIKKRKTINNLGTQLYADIYVDGKFLKDVIPEHDGIDLQDTLDCVFHSIIREIDILEKKL